jgi:hypothetical protein
LAEEKKLLKNLFQVSAPKNAPKLRVARWHIFKTKIPVWENFGGSCNGRCWYITYMAIWSILLPFGIFCDHFGIFYVYSYIFSPVRYVVPKKSGNPGQALISQVEESQKEIKISSNFLSEKPHLRPKSILMCESTYVLPGTDAMILKIFSQKKLQKH